MTQPHVMATSDPNQKPIAKCCSDNNLDVPLGGPSEAKTAAFCNWYCTLQWVGADLIA
jgi:hypothetical protein